MSAVRVGDGKGSLSKYGLQWGRMLDPTFIPLKNSDLLPKPVPPPPSAPVPVAKPVLNPAKTVVNSATATVAGTKPVVAKSMAIVTSDAKVAAELEENASEPPSKVRLSAVSSSLTGTQQSIVEWMQTTLGLEINPVIRKGQAAAMGKIPPFTSSSVGPLMQCVCAVLLVATA